MEYAVTVGFTFCAEDGHEPTQQEIYRHLLLAITDPNKVNTHFPTDKNETTEDILIVEIRSLT